MSAITFDYDSIYYPAAPVIEIEVDGYDDNLGVGHRLIQEVNFRGFKRYLWPIRARGNKHARLYLWTTGWIKR
jgi:hypothetical protein